MTLFNGSFEKVALAAVPRSKYRSNSAGREQLGLLELSERGHAAQTRRKAVGEGGQWCRAGGDMPGVSTVWMACLPGRGPGEAVASGASQTPSWRSQGKPGVWVWGSEEHAAPETDIWLSVSPGMVCSVEKKVMATVLAH